MSKLLAGRYELIEQIGEGGMAVVYKARCRLLNRYVAIKILRPEFTKDAQFIESFKRESQAAAGLQHPNIISVYDVGREGDINYIVMELVDGKPLSDVIDEKGPMDYKEAIDITKQVASALSLAHKNNIIHRDIKPHNIMITKSGIAKLGDFGIAKAVSNSTIVADTKKVIGSVHYFSPEQARGGKVDESSDIYSLGIVLYEMLTGRVPFDGDNPVQVALMHINDQITPPSELVGGIPPALEKLVMKATDKYPSNRYQSADEILEELDNIEFVTKVVGNGVFAASQNGISDEELGEPDVQVKKPRKKPKKSMNKKQKTIMFSCIGVAALILILLILHFTGVMGKGDIEVPDLKGMTYSEAEKLLEEKGLNIKEGDKVPSDEIKKGRIVTQDPTEGTMVKKGRTITVDISQGRKEGVIPNLIGMEYPGNIKSILEDHGYELGRVTEKESDSPEGVVISQTPKAGTDKKEGTTVDIVISKGKEKPKVPTLTGMTVSDAKNAIVNAGFQVGNITYGESNVYKGGYVMNQQYTPGSELEKGKTIDLVVAKEHQPEPEPEPNQGGENQNNGGGEQGGETPDPGNQNPGQGENPGEGQ